MAKAPKMKAPKGGKPMPPMKGMDKAKASGMKAPKGMPPGLAFKKGGKVC